MMVSFVLSFFPRDVLDEILKLIESVSEDFPSYSCNTERSKGNFVRENLKTYTINENVLLSEDSLIHYKGHPSNYLFPLFLKVLRL